MTGGEQRFLILVFGGGSVDELGSNKQADDIDVEPLSNCVRWTARVGCGGGSLLRKVLGKQKAQDRSLRILRDFQMIR